MTLSPDNMIVNGLWIGGALTPLELLTIRSFQSNGHTFVLWTYDGITTSLPEGTILRDANEVLDRSHIFSYKHVSEWGHGRGSYAGFSDIFRYKLLYERGGWWTDMDITCLKPLAFDSPYAFRNHDVLPVVGNLIKCPPKSELMRVCFERGVREVNADNKYWLKPVEILNEEIARLELSQYIRPGITNSDKWDVVLDFIHKDSPLPDSFFGIHWMNEVWRTNSFPKDVCMNHSTLARLHKKYGTTEGIKWKREDRIFKVKRFLSLIFNKVKKIIKSCIRYIAIKINRYDELKRAQFAFHYYRRNKHMLRYDLIVYLNSKKLFTGIKPVLRVLYRTLKTVRNCWS
jgi:Glycosyltransferase sugar-binding region containing DXD motif